MIILLEILVVLPLTIGLGLSLGNLIGESTDTTVLLFIGSIALMFYIKYNNNIKNVFFCIYLMLFYILVRELS